MAPRVEVYTEIACRAVHESDKTLPSSPTPRFYEYLMPRADVFDPRFGTEDANTVVSLTNRSFQSLDECSSDPRVQGRAARIQACKAFSYRSRPSVSCSATNPQTSVCSCQNSRECAQRDHDRLALPHERCSRPEEDTCHHRLWRPLHVPITSLLLDIPMG